jgi:homoserine kinase
VSAFRTDEVRVLAPASSANLGPGFDSAGLALGLEDELFARVNDVPGVVVEVTGECAQSVPLDESHLVVRAMNLAFDAMGARPIGFTLRCVNRIPHGRGLGSSAAAIIGGMVLARALVAEPSQRLTDIQLLHTALALESHPDNLAAALFGGVTIAWLDEQGAPDFVCCAPHSLVQPVLAFPDTPLATKTARKALPDSIPLSDAVHNIARSALLLHAMTSDPSKLLAATSDRLHQDARASMYPETMELVAKLRGHGIAAFVSGAGPAVLALGIVDQGKMAAAAPADWTVLSLPVSALGAREVT